MNSRSLRAWGSVLLLVNISAAPAGHDAHSAPAAAPAAPPKTETAAPSPDDALKMLVAGNQRFVSDKSEHPNASQLRRCDTFLNGQHPFAVVLSCADSRAPVEYIFDQGIGDLFTIRVAGNVADVDEIGTVEYGVGHLHSPLIVVMGHTKCGAVTAVANEAKVSPNIAQLVDNIVPAVQGVRKSMPGLHGDAFIQAAIDANVFQGMRDMLTRSEEIRELVNHGKVKIVGAVYDLHNGTVRWLGEHPNQKELLGAPVSHETAAAKPELIRDNHDAHNAHAAPAHGKPAAADHAAKDAHAPKSDSADHHEPAHGPKASAEDHSEMPHQSGTWKGMMVPAAFLGGAGLVSTGVIYWMKSRTPAATAPASEASHG